jgi:hypothetical protein
MVGYIKTGHGERPIKNWRRAAIFLGAFGLLSCVQVIFGPSRHLPIKLADGLYANNCCAALILSNGHGRSGAVSFDYSIESSKTGPMVLLSRHFLSVKKHALVLEQDQTGLFLPVDTSSPPRWIDIDGTRFSRAAERQGR